MRPFSGCSSASRSRLSRASPRSSSWWLSIVVDVSRSRSLQRVAKKYKSQALEADALHFSTDVWSSTVVLLGLFGVLAAKTWGQAWLVNADTVAALGVASIVVWVSLKLGKKSVDDLLDRIPEELRDQVVDAASGVPGVREVTQVRMRRSGPEVFADITLSVGETTSFEKAHEIADQVGDAVRGVVPEADVVVHAEPLPLSELGLTAKVGVIAARHNMGAHAVRIYEEEGRRWLETHLEVQESLSLEEAHCQASEFEHDLLAEMPELSRVVTHLEPVGDSTAIIQAEPADETDVHRALKEFFRKSRMAKNLHNVTVQQAGGELLVSFHCRLDPTTTIIEAHDFTVKVEEFLRSRIPNLARVLVHVEPRKAAN